MSTNFRGKSAAFLRGHWRLLLGLCFIGFALVALLRNFVLVNATDAFINATLLAVRSPIPGQVLEPLPPPGTRILVTPVTTAKIHNERADETLSIEVTERLDQLESALASSTARLEKLQKAADEFATWSKRHANARDAYLAERLLETQADTMARQKELENASNTLQRLEGASAYVSRGTLDNAQTAVQVAQESLAAAKAKQAQVISERRALTQRIQIADSYSERTWSEQKLQETRLQITLLQADIAALEQQRETLLDNLKRSRNQLNRESAADVPLPDAVVWRRVPPGAHVVRGGEIGEVAPCSEAVITITLDRSAFRKLHIGMQASARFRMDDGQPRQVKATVVTLTGGSQENVLGMAIPFGRAIVEDAYGAVLRTETPQALECAIGKPVSLQFG